MRYRPRVLPRCHAQRNAAKDRAPWGNRPPEYRTARASSVWRIDLADGGAALVIALLLNRDQQFLHIPGRAVNRTSEGYRGDGKTDARDAAVIADQARIRRDPAVLRPGDELVSELKALVRHRRDLSDDRTRTINRLRGHLTEILPGLERELDLGNVGPLVLLTGYQTPAAIRRTGRRRLTTWLRNRKVRSSDELAAKAVQAAEGQYTSVPGEDMTAPVMRSLAREVMALNEKIAEVDKLIEGRFRQHRNAEMITSMPGIGPLLGAEFLAAPGGDMTPSPARTGWPPSPASPRCPAIPARSAATCTAPPATAAASNASSTPPRWSSSAAATSPVASTTASAPKAKDTARPSWPSHADESTSCGPFCATDGATNQYRPSPWLLDNSIRNRCADGHVAH